MPRKKQTKEQPIILKEQSLVLVKPDGVKRGLVGDIVNRFEKAGLKVVALKMVKPTRDHFDCHYPSSQKFLNILATKTIEGYKAIGLDVKKELGTTSKKAIGQKVKDWLLDYMTSGPVVAMVIEGAHAVKNVRLIVGSTNPLEATPGTIRGDFTTDSASLANFKKRPIKNVIHASGEIDEAEEEVKLWFSFEEIHDYKRADEEIIF